MPNNPAANGSGSSTRWTERATTPTVCRILRSRSRSATARRRWWGLCTSPVKVKSSERDGGAFLNERPLQMASPSKSLSASLVATGFAYYQGAALGPHVATLETVMNVATDVLRLGSAATDISYVAAGRLGAYYESGLKPWDVAAAALIVQEAGGIVCETSGQALDLFARNGATFSLNVLAAKNADIQRQMIDLLATRYTI